MTSNDGTKHTSERLPEEPHKVYQAPTLTVFNANEAETGNTNVPESSNGLVS
jgi:hypothetical protein